MNELKRTTKALHALLVEQGYTGTYNQLLHLTARARGHRSWQELAAQVTPEPTDPAAFVIIETGENSVRQVKGFAHAAEAAAYAHAIGDACGYAKVSGQADWYAEERMYSGVCAFDVRAQDTVQWPDEPEWAEPDDGPQQITLPTPVGAGALAVTLAELRRFGTVAVLVTREELCASVRAAAPFPDVHVVNLTHPEARNVPLGAQVIVWLYVPAHAEPHADAFAARQDTQMTVKFISAPSSAT